MKEPRYSIQDHFHFNDIFQSLQYLFLGTLPAN